MLYVSLRLLTYRTMPVTNKLVATRAADSFDGKGKAGVFQDALVAVSDDALNQRPALVRVQVFAGREVLVSTNPSCGSYELGGVRC